MSFVLYLSWVIYLTDIMNLPYCLCFVFISRKKKISKEKISSLTICENCTEGNVVNNSQFDNEYFL